MPFAELDSRRLFLLRRGSGEPLLLIQGMGGHHAAWGEPFLSRLTPDFDVLAWSELHAFDGTGHFFWWEHPAATAELVRRHCLGG